MTFQEVAIESAQRYYQFLSDEGKGVMICRVIKREIDDRNIYLFLDGKLPYPEFVNVRIYNTVYAKRLIETLGRFGSSLQADKLMEAKIMYPQSLAEEYTAFLQEIIQQHRE